MKIYCTKTKQVWTSCMTSQRKCGAIIMTRYCVYDKHPLAGWDIQCQAPDSRSRYATPIWWYYNCLSEFHGTNVHCKQHSSIVYSLFLWEPSLRLTGEWIENRLYIKPYISMHFLRTRNTCTKGENMKYKSNLGINKNKIKTFFLQHFIKLVLKCNSSLHWLVLGFLYGFFIQWSISWRN